MHEQFFTPGELKATVILRPKEWWQWWRAEPLITKVFAAAMAVTLGCGLYQLRVGDKGVGWGLVFTVLVLLGLILLVAVLASLTASVRWMLRRLGVLDTTRRLARQTWKVITVAFWVAVVFLVLAALWPYVSLDPLKSWYAFNYGVPVERVSMDRKPHDCEFTTAPLGEKNCHYEARPYVLKAEENSDHRQSVIISYEKVQD